MYVFTGNLEKISPDSLLTVDLELSRNLALGLSCFSGHGEWGSSDWDLRQEGDSGW